MDERRELANPLISSYGTPAVQQVMSPTQGTPALEHGTRAFSGSTPPLETGHSGAEGFEPRAAGRASGSAGQHESLQDSGEASQVSTTTEGGVEAHRSVPLPSMMPGESSGLQANTGRSGTVTEQVRRDGEAAPEGLVAEDFHEGFVTPRSQQGLPTIAEMVEGIPSASRFMSGIGSFFRVARTEVMQVPSAWQTTHDTPPRSTTLSRDSPEGQRALGERSLGSHSSSPWVCRALPLPLARLPKGMASCSVRTFCSACRLCSRGPPYFMVIHPIGPQVDRTPHLCHRRLFRQRLQGSLQGLIKGPRCRMPRSLG